MNELHREELKKTQYNLHSRQREEKERGERERRKRKNNKKIEEFVLRENFQVN